MKYFLSAAPARQNVHRRWFKSIKTKAGLGGDIVANVYGSTKEQAENRAEDIILALDNLYNSRKEDSSGSKK